MNYNGVKLGTEDPFVGLSTEIVLYGGKLCAIQKISVQGKIYGSTTVGGQCQDVLAKILSFSKTLSDDYKQFSAGGFTAPKARCEYLSITNSSTFGAEYSAEFLAYPDEWFTDVIGVLEPVDSVKVVENRDGTITITRSVSGRGVSDGSNGIKKVTDWIKTLNIHLITDPKISQIAGIKNIPINSSMTPSRISQNSNRLDASASAEVEFTFNKGSNTKSTLNVSTDISYDAKIGIYIITVNGTLSGPIDLTNDELETQFLAFKPFDFANAQLPSGAPPLDEGPVSFSVDRNDNDISINFSYVYNTLIGDKIIKSTTTIEHDVVKDIKTIALQGTISLNKKAQSLRKTQKDTLTSTFKFNEIADSEYTKYFLNRGGATAGSVKLSTKVPKSYSLSMNETDFTANYNISYDNSTAIDPKLNLPEEVYSFVYQVNYAPSFAMKSPLQFIPGNQGIMDLKAKRRGSLTINGTALATKKDLQQPILDALVILIDGVKVKESFINPHIQQKICNYYVEADNTFKYTFEMSITAETKMYGS